MNILAKWSPDGGVEQNVRIVAFLQDCNVKEYRKVFAVCARSDGHLLTADLMDLDVIDEENWK